MEEQAHGTLVEVLDLGVLLLGPSGIGKSECALELVHRGHRLIADDVVRIRTSGGGLVGTAPDVIRHYMEIRGIGLLFIPDVYGPEAVRDEASVDLVLQVEEWKEGAQYERVGAERPTRKIAGVEVPELVLPARPAGSMATLVEVAVRDHLQRQQGRVAAQRIDEQFRARGSGQSE